MGGSSSRRRGTQVEVGVGGAVLHGYRTSLSKRSADGGIRSGFGRNGVAYDTKGDIGGSDRERGTISGTIALGVFGSNRVRIGGVSREVGVRVCSTRYCGELGTVAVDTVSSNTTIVVSGGIPCQGDTGALEVSGTEVCGD